MDSRPLFATTRKKTRIAPWIRVSALILGVGSLGMVIAKISIPTDPALDQRIDLSIADAIAPTPPEPDLVSQSTNNAPSAESPTSTASLFNEDPLPDPALTLTLPQTPPDEPTEPAPVATTIKVKSGDSLSTIFSRLGLNYQTVSDVIAVGDQAAPLKNLRPGDQLNVELTPDNQLLAINYQLAPNKTLSIRRDANDQFTADKIVLPMETRLTTAEGVIDSSLYQSAIESGLSANMVMELADIFGWKINFLKDVQNGDHFRIVYEEKYVNGKHVDTGAVVAAEFVNNGKTYQAVRYTAPNGKTGYYEPNGASLARGFLRYPVAFSRISSKFNMHRMHPLYHKIRAHKGVDFAAPTGTPIHAAGRGKIEFIGWQHGYGKVIKIKHDGGFETVYGHMSRFNNQLKRGSSVDMGETIGYVGMTGAATGPHLHYEFHVKGVYTDPLVAKLPEANPIPSKYRQDFLAQTQSALDLMAKDERQAAQTVTNTVTATAD
ncbi:peptidoglycan DD-metalloendopeptidase family protein [Halothiobacillus neapolitanus]|uniref:Peptidase M23 n=1 Tax=Halothiobacillus neapolitanus (strain ATCC 23641 / DSM 15147 / CIP 104769 / NCIMB 8539 / c2) TaxID=555778 RepID=D0KW53_HALNC|nr:peptidoglycan DD-metalloendopeptidase family protein [Halothiobacillus neapolitanus]ACX96956.1 Peptidase M23 [Halothiobacillus neapolitanus c2]TDN59827.1 murein DD-endopeptidase MepM/ murein hydrolase activator NlpD [Halothiobacillus neapolitanus]